MASLRIVVDDTVLTAEWTEDNQGTRAAVVEALPIDGPARRWGDELYVSTDVAVTPTDTQDVVPRGAVAYWPAGPALCVFWGPTPASTDERPRAASPVAVLARLDDVSPLAAIDGGATLRFENQSNCSV